MADRPLSVACDLSRLDPEERKREQDLLTSFRKSAREVGTGERSARFAVAADAVTLSAVAELLAYERLCCPFLEFRLTVTAADSAVVEITCAPGVAADAPIVDFIRTEFGRAPGSGWGAGDRAAR